MMRSSLAGIVILAVMMPTFGLTDLPARFDADSGFDTMVGADAWNGPYSFAGSGADPAVANARWTSGYSMHPGQNYYAGMNVYPYPAEDAKIPGNAEDLYVLGDVCMELRGTYGLTCERRFIALPGARFQFMQAGYTFSSTAVEVRSTAANPFTICMRCSHSATSSATLNFPLEGPADAVLRLPYTFDDGTDTGGTMHTYNYKGDASAYYGDIIVDGAKMKAGGYECLALGTAELGGSIVLTNRATLKKADSKLPSMKGLFVSSDSYLQQDSDGFTIGDFAFADGGAVRYSTTTPGLITVTNSFVRGNGRFVLDFNHQKMFPWTIDKSIAGDPTTTNELFRFAAGVTVQTDDFEIANIAPGYGSHLPVPYLVVARNGDGTSSLLLTHRPIVFALKNLNMSDSDSETAAWSDNRPSHPDADYVLTWISAAQSRAERAMEVPMYVQVSNEGRNTFAGGSLTVISGILWSYASDCRIDDLYFENKGQLAQNNSNPAAAIAGRIGILATDADHPARFHPSKGRLRIASSIYGAEEAVLLCDASAPMTFAGDNADYAGRLLLRTSSTVGLAHPNALGDGNDAFVYNAIELDNPSLVLSVTTNVGITCANRGVFLRQGATISVDSNCTFRSQAPFTFTNTLVKTGAGTLAFAAPARFSDGAEATPPTVDANLLTVSEGTVEIADADALNGLVVSFDPAARLLIDDCAENDPLRDYGACLTRWSDPLGSTSSLTVRVVDEDISRSKSRIKRGIMTFATRAEAEAALTKLSVRSLPDNCRGHLAVEEKTRDDATVYTVVGEFGMIGFILWFK